MGFPKGITSLIAGTNIMISNPNGPQPTINAAGGTPPGVAIVRHFPFAFNTPGILTGAALYTPTVGDILLNGWIEVDTAWNGTTPKGDFGDFVSSAFGYLNVWQAGNVIDMTAIDSQPTSSMAATVSQAFAAAVGSSLELAQLNGNTRVSRVWPAKFINTDPIKICVSQNGKNTGANPGATQGAGVLYLVTATPA